MPSRRQPADSEEHRYDLFVEGRQVGSLVWRSHPRESAGWFLVPKGGAPQRLSVDAAIDDLAAQAGDEHAWALHAELAAILSTALALDAAERVLHGRPARRERRFRRPEMAHYEIRVRGVAPAVLARAVPEMALRSVSGFATLEGDLPADAVPTVLRRLALLGGTIVES